MSIIILVFLLSKSFRYEAVIRGISIHNYHWSWHTTIFLFFHSFSLTFLHFFRIRSCLSWFLSMKLFIFSSGLHNLQGSISTSSSMMTWSQWVTNSEVANRHDNYPSCSTWLLISCFLKFKHFSVLMPLSYLEVDLFPSINEDVSIYKFYDFLE